MSSQYGKSDDELYEALANAEEEAAAASKTTPAHPSASVAPSQEVKMYGLKRAIDSGDIDRLATFEANAYTPNRFGDIGDYLRK